MAMAMATTKAQCSKCNEENNTYICKECSKTFCFNHLNNHWEIFNEQFNKIKDDCSSFQQTLIDRKNNPKNRPLVEQIDKWEEDSIKKIKQTAHECRQILINYTNTFIIEIENKLNDLTGQFKQIRKENKCNEIDLNQLKDKLIKLTEELDKPPNVSIKQESASFINKIFVNISPHKDTKWKQDRTNIAGGKGSGFEKKPKEDRSFTGRASKPSTGKYPQLGSSQGGPALYPLQPQSPRELARENSQRDRGSALESLKKTTKGSGINTAGTSSMTNSHESSVSERLSTQMSKTSTNKSSAVINKDLSNTSFNEENTQARVHSLIEEYTENYSESNDRLVKEALEDLSAFRTPSLDQQALIVRELFTNVLEAKSRARKAVGHLLDAALNEEILSTDAFLTGFKMIVDVAPDYAVDIPLIWQYIGEIIGALIGAPTLNMSLLKPILQYVPEDKSKQLFQYIIRYATEFSSQSRIQKFWQSSGFLFSDLIKSDLVDSSFVSEYDWLLDTPESEPTTLQSKENLSPRADPQLVRLFKSISDQGTSVTDPEIITYIREHMEKTEKFYIRNIVLSYLEACLINRDPQKKIREDIAKKRMTILNAIIKHKPEAEIQAVYAIQNFVNKLEHPPKMARLLFDIFFDEECVSEDTFFEWLKHPDQSEAQGHAVVEMSTKDFFSWLQQAETEVEEGEEEEN